MTDEKEKDDALVPSHLHRQSRAAGDDDDSRTLEDILDLFQEKIIDSSATPKCTLVTLCHWALSNTGTYAHEVIDTHPVRGRSEETRRLECEQIAQACLKAAKASAKLFDRPQRYSVQCYSKAQGEMLGRRDFLILGVLDPRLQGLETEPANQFGALAQSMRHHEGVARQFVTINAETMRLWADELQHQREHYDRLLASHERVLAESFHRVKEYETILISHLRERQELEKLRYEIELRKARGEFADANNQEAKAWQVVESLMPVLLQSVAPGGAAEKAKPMVETALALVKNGSANGAGKA